MYSIIDLPSCRSKKAIQNTYHLVLIEYFSGQLTTVFMIAGQAR